MLKNYFKTAWRSLTRNLSFTVINMAGLALGLTVFIFILQFVVFEWSANRFNKHYNELYRVNVQYKKGNIDYYLPPGYAPIVKSKFPAIENFASVADGIAAGVITWQPPKGERKVFREDDIKFVTGEFLNVFSFPILAGAPSLAEPKTMALSETVCRKIFGNINVIGKVLTVSNQFGNTPYVINAVYSVPAASDIKPAALLSLHTLESAANRGGNDWADPTKLESGFASIYLQLKGGTNAETFAKGITDFVRAANPGSKDDAVLLQPFANLHLAPSFSYPAQTFGNLLLVVVFSGIAILILIIGWVNYINLSTAQALNRGREVGVRKVLGASRGQLMFQFLTEAFLLTIASTIIALLLVTIFQKTFNDFTGKDLSLAVLNQGWIWIAALALLVTGFLLSGSYVAFVLTAQKAIDTIKGKLAVGNKRFSLRKGLVVFQFTVSIVLIIATLIIYRQLHYMGNAPLGMNLNQLLVIQGPTVSSDAQAQKNSAFKDALAQLPFVSKYTASNNVPGVGYNFSANGIKKFNEPQPGDDQKQYSMFICDEHFFDTYGIAFKQGHGFSRNDADASWNNVKKVIINEKAAQSLGFDNAENIIGKKISWGAPYEVIGVVKDYHHLSLREAIKPTIYLGSVSFYFFTVQTDTRNMQSKIAALKKLYNSSFPGNPFDYFFADERYDKQYAEEQKLGNVFTTAAALAIFIACLGLFGLAAFSAQQRVKEIGIRKVLGASVSGIAQLLSKDFIRLVLLSICIASPIAWWGMNKWLQDFAYRTAISWWIFFAAGLIAVFIAVATISFQAVKAARANPIKRLRTE